MCVCVVHYGQGDAESGDVGFTVYVGGACLTCTDGPVVCLYGVSGLYVVVTSVLSEVGRLDGGMVRWWGGMC